MIWIVIGFGVWLICDAYKDYKINKELADIKSELIQRSMLTMPEYIDKCKKCYHFQVCANVMKNQLFIREKMLLEENPECERFISAEDAVEVVRCKDCIHRDKAGLCQAEGQKLTIVKDNHFCGKGERKDGNGNG